MDEPDKSLPKKRKRGAPLNNKRALGNRGGGRKPKYHTTFARIARKACGRGLTCSEIAYLLDVSPATIHRWRLQYPQFSRAWTLGRGEADRRVERALYERAVGYSFQAEKVIDTPNGPQTVRWHQHIPPDTAAALAYLRNRCPDRWRDAQRTAHSVTPYHKIEDTKELRTLLRKRAQQLGLIPQPTAQKAPNGPT
jgi:transposase-like protein